MKFSTLALCFILSLRAVGQTVVNIQPHFSAGCEADLFSYFPTGSGGYLQPEFNIVAWTSGGTSTIDRHLLRFDALTDTSVIPAGTHISSAKLVLFGRSTSPEGNWGNSLYPGTPYPNANNGWIYPVATSFNKFTVNWATQPAYLHTDSVAIPISSAQWSQNDTMDITSLVVHLMANGNKGLMFKLASENPYAERMWATCNETDSTKHPLLIVTFCPNLITASPQPDTVVAGTDAKFFVNSPTIGVLYQWQENPGTGFVNLANVWPYSGVTTDTLTIHNTSIHLDATHYRCIASDDIHCTDTSTGALLTVRAGVGVDELGVGSFAIFPNPTIGILNITGNNLKTVTIYDMTGRIVKEHPGSNSNKTSINLSPLPPGIYMVTVIDISGNKTIQKITKE